MHSDTWCPIPFVAISYHPTGSLTRCMMSEVSMSNNLDWDNQTFQNLRQNMLEGKWDLPGCDSCFKKEQVGITSKRQEWLVGNVKKRLSNNAYNNPTLTNNKIRHLFLNFNNICNFKCRMCSPKYSNSLIPEWNHYNWYNNNEKDLSKNINNVTEFIEQNKDKLKDVTQIYITGGEPFIGDTIFNVRELLYKYAVPENIHITITTNGSKVDVNKLQEFNKFKKMHLDVSIDAVGPMFEYMRSNKVFTWKQMDLFIKDKLIPYAQKNNNWFYFSLNSSYQIFNADNIAQIYEYKHNLTQKYKINIDLNQRVLIGPEMFQTKNCPSDIKKTAEESINNLLKKSWVTAFDIKNIKDCQIMLNKPQNKDQWERFVKRTIAQDTFRNISLKDYNSNLANYIYS